MAFFEPPTSHVAQEVGVKILHTLSLYCELIKFHFTSLRGFHFEIFFNCVVLVFIAEKMCLQDLHI